MNKIKTAEKWLEKNNHDQHKWAMTYLDDRKLAPGYDRYKGITYDYVLGWLIHTEQKYPDVFRKLKLAWNSHNFYNKPGVTSCSFVLSDNAHSALKKLAKKAPLNKTIEELIFRGMEYEQWAKATYKEEIDKHKNELTKKYITKNDDIIQANINGKIGKDLERQKEAYTALVIKMNYLLQDMAMDSIRMDDAKFNALPLSDEQKRRAFKKYLALKEMHLGANLAHITVNLDAFTFNQENESDRLTEEVKTNIEKVDIATRISADFQHELEDSQTKPTMTSCVSENNEASDIHPVSEVSDAGDKSITTDANEGLDTELSETNTPNIDTTTPG